ncbi:MAG: GAF domain-containing protein, partial [Chloroflexota bacterium]|nr:GAF domain-containing protein [Chloroflexota bacterium]
MTDLNQDKLRRELTALRAENRTLKEELTRTHSAFQQGVDGVCSMDATGRILSANPTFSKTVKLPAAEICEQDLADLCLEAERDRVRTALARVSALNQAERIEFQLSATADEGQAHELLATPANSIEGEPEILGIIHDITSYKGLEEDLQTRNAQLESLHQLSIKLTSELDRETLLQTIVTQACELLGSIFCVLGLRHPEREVLRQVAHTGAAPPQRYIRRGEGLAGQVWEKGAPIRVDNYQSWEGRLSSTSDGEFPIALLGVPISWSGEFLGVLQVGRQATRPFTAADVMLLELFASLSAVALHNAHLYQTAQEGRATVEALTQASLAVNSVLEFEQVLDLILEQVAQVVTGDAYNIMVLEANLIRVVRWKGYERFGVESFISGAVFPSKTTNYQQMLKSGQPIVIRD